MKKKGLRQRGENEDGDRNQSHFNRSIGAAGSGLYCGFETGNLGIETLKLACISRSPIALLSFANHTKQKKLKQALVLQSRGKTDECSGFFLTERICNESLSVTITLVDESFSKIHG